MSLPKIVLDCFRNNVEIPLLTHGILSPSSKIDIISSYTFSNSLHRKSRSDVEWSVDVESPVFVKPLSWFFLSLVNIDNFPSLLWLFTSIDDQDRLTFSILTILNIKTFTTSTVDVAEVVSLVFEQLEPSRIRAPDLHLISSSSTLDVP
jgi:hypothetical protein